MNNRIYLENSYYYLLLNRLLNSQDHFSRFKFRRLSLNLNFY